MKTVCLFSIVLCATIAAADDIAPNQGTLYSGIWVSGTDANYYEAGLTLDALKTLAETRHKEGLRIIDLETYMVGAQRKWAALWRSGSDADYFSVGLTASGFHDLLQQRHQQNLRIISMTSYVEGGERK